LPEGEQLTDLLFSLVRVDNGNVPGIVPALAHDLGLDYDALARDPAAPAVPAICNLQFAICNLQFAICNLQSPLRTNGDVLESLTAVAKRLIEECWRTGLPLAQNHKLQIANCKLQIDQTLKPLRFLVEVIRPRLLLCHQEIDHILTALE